MGGGVVVSVCVRERGGWEGGGGGGEGVLSIHKRCLYSALITSTANKANM